MPNQFLTVDEVAEVLRVDRRTVISLIKTGRLSATKPFKSYLVDRDGLEAVLAENRVLPRSA